MRSFEIDHNKLIPGIYKHSVSGLVTTWDIRVKTPNSGDYLTPAVIHSLEHTLAVYLRERFGNYKIVGIFPMGCQTGFYVLTRFIDGRTIYETIVDYCWNIQNLKSVPGASSIQCGQYELQDLRRAQDEMLVFYESTLRYHISAMKYPH